MWLVNYGLLGIKSKFISYLQYKLRGEIFKAEPLKVVVNHRMHFIQEIYDKEPIVL